MFSIYCHRKDIHMEPVRLNPTCIACQMRQHLNGYPEDLPLEEKVAYMKEVLRVIAETPNHCAAPSISRTLQHYRTEKFHNLPDFAPIKKYYNDLMLARIDDFRATVRKSPDPTRTAFKLALAGNYIDFGAMKTVDDKRLDDLIANCEEISFSEDNYQRFLSELAKAKKLVYLTDNCGEVVVDRVLIEHLKERFPALEITVLVRGEEIANDATMVDARQVGLDKVTRVLGNGSDIAGTELSELSEEALSLIREADVILSKGQGNFETLQYCGLNIYYLFLSKCEYFAKHFDVPLFTGLFVRELDEHQEL